MRDDAGRAVQRRAQLLAAADLWVFVTTANRYADAVPWRLLLDAASRDITVAVVLDRVPAAAEDEVSADLQSMLSREGMGGARLFVVPEVALDGMGMLPPAAVEPLRLWLQVLAADAAGRADIARRTLNGTVKALGNRGTLAVCNVHGAVLSLFQLTRMDRVFSLHPTREDAMARLGA